MPVDPSALVEAIANGFGVIPSAVLAAAILGAPTAIWLIARITNPPGPPMRDEATLESLLWVCTSCLSINEDRLETCYRCHRVRAAESIPVVIEPGLDGSPRVGVAVGPGLPAGQGSANSWLGGELRKLTEAARSRADRSDPEDEFDPDESPPEFEPVVIEPKVKVSGRASAVAPAVRRAERRQAKASSEATPKRNSKNRAS